MKTLIMSLVLFVSAAQAGVLQNGPEEGAHHGVHVYSKASYDVDGSKGDMNLVNWALRTAMGGVVKIAVYEFFLSDLNSFARNEEKALESMASQPSAAMRITYVYSVTAGQVYPKVKATVDANGIGSDPVIVELMKIFKTMDIDAGQTTEYLLYKNTDGTESLVFTDAQGEKHVYKGPTGLMNTIFKLWIGNTADGDSAKVKTQLIMGGAQ